MNLKRIQFIIDYFDTHREEHFVYVIIHSLLNCLTEEEITFLYFDIAIRKKSLKKSIESYVAKKTSNKPKRTFDRTAKILLKKYPKQSYREQLITRTFLSNFIQSLPKSTIKIFFDLLINSERKVDRQKANGVAHLIWDDEVEGHLRANLRKYNDEESLIPLVINLKEKDLCDLAQDLWNTDFPQPRIKNLITKRVENEPLDRLKFLETVDPSYYMQILNKKGKRIGRKTIARLLKTVNEHNRNYIIWCLGLTGDWSLVTKQLRKRTMTTSTYINGL